MESSEIPEQSQNELPPAHTLVTETDSSPPRGNPFPIVGVGASAGGLEAFGQLLEAVPADSGMAFVLVQHLDPQHESLLPELLARVTSMPVVTVRDGMAIQPNHVYAIPPNTSMELSDGRLRLARREPGLHLPIDIFFLSLAKVQGSKAIGVVLSGNASDGSVGVRAIKAECGVTFAQDEVTARFGGMPRNAVATGAVDYVLPPAEIGRELGVIGSHPYLIPSSPGDGHSETLPEGKRDLKRIFALLHAATKVDFSHYKPTTVRRRIGRRMMVLRHESMAEYARHAEQHPSELRELYRDLLISVTCFFRDPESFDALARILSNSLGDRAERDRPLRVWVPGCATGEEVYSIAIRLHELLAEQQVSLPIQLFGTDISDIALERARQGIYPEIIARDVSEERRRRFFTKVDSGYQINKMIRESCLFAHQDVTRDPPFSHLDLVSCRNVLIYLDAVAQRRVLPTFHYALKPAGLLMLSSAETTASAADLFTYVDKQHHIYSRQPVPARFTLDVMAPGPGKGVTMPERPAGTTAPADLQKRVDRIIQSKYSPAALLVSAEMQILQFRGHTTPYLDPAPGEASLNLLRMAKDSLVLPLRRAVQSAAESNGIVCETAVPVENHGTIELTDVEVTPVIGSDPGERYFLIVFNSGNGRAGAHAGSSSPLHSLPVDEHVRTLERELAETREYLRNITEEYEAHGEELRAANEEARSANEELQSTNEELGTTKEELQSANEELTTLNEELHSRNGELGATNSDLRNLLSAVSVAILMVDHDLRVRRFNNEAEKLLNLASVDIGRPVGHIRGNIETPRLEQQVRSVIETLHAIAEEVQDHAGMWHSVAVRPYRTLDDRIAGAVVTFQDIDPLKRVRAAEEARDYAEALIETVREPLVVLDADLRVQRATPAFYDKFLVSREETEGRLLYDLGSGQWNQPRLRELIGAALFRSEPFHDFEVQHDFPHIGRRTVRLNGRRIPRPDPQNRMLLLSIEDVTERREIAEIQFQRMFETAKDGMVLVHAEAETVQNVNPYFLALSGFARDNFVGKRLMEAGRVIGIPEVHSILAETQRQEIVRQDDLQLTRRDGSRISIEVVANRYKVGSQPVVQLNVRDITQRKLAERALRESDERFRMFVESVHDYALFQMDPRGLILSWNSGAERVLGWTEAEAIGHPSALVFVPEDVAQREHEKEIETARAKGRAEDERWHIRKDGSRFFASGVLTRVLDDTGQLVGFAKVMRDITDRLEKEQQLRRSLEEKSVLVREIHHRVKNNLQVIVSLLSLQANYTSDPRVLAAFEETEGRVRAIAHIHERLYASEDLTDVEFGAYLTSLVRELMVLHSADNSTVNIELSVTDMVLHIEQAIPLGLITNELVINSLKHGLKNGPGSLRVSLDYDQESVRPELGQTLDEGWAKVTVEDTGPGLPPDLNLERTGSMGFRLIHLLVRQLSGRLEVGKGPGARLSVSFPLSHKGL